MRINNDIEMLIGGVKLRGELHVSSNSKSIVIFSHGSGSSRKSPRNQMVARKLEDHGIGTLLFDLLTEEEDQNYYSRFNIDLLSQRLVEATRWLMARSEAKHCHLGYFGASTGAASALKAAAVLPGIEAVVCRGGRPDLALDSLANVKAAVLLIVGNLDRDVLDLNRIAYSYLKGEHKLEVIEGASHLFEETGKLELVADEAVKWFDKYLNPVNKQNSAIYV